MQTNTRRQRQEMKKVNEGENTEGNGEAKSAEIEGKENGEAKSE